MEAYCPAGTVLACEGETAVLANIYADQSAIVGLTRHLHNPVSQYRNFTGYTLPTYGEVIWHYPDGDVVYGKLEIRSVAYNA